jgi:4-carboxymuconolactone decarboxylase
MSYVHPADPRVAPVEDPTPEVAELLAKTMADESGVPLSIFRTMARHPRMMKRFNVLGGFFIANGLLPERERELVVLHTAWRCGCLYEWAQHVLIGGRAGLTAEEIERVATPGREREWEPFDALLLRAADEILTRVDLTEDTWAALGERWGDELRMELVMLVGFYRMAAGFLNATGVVKDDELPGWPAGMEKPGMEKPGMEKH